MLMQSNFTRRAAFGQGLLEELSEIYESVGLGCDLAISRAAREKVCELGGCGQDDDYLQEMAWSYRLHESGKLPPVALVQGADGPELTFRAFLNNCGSPVEIVLKAVRGRGDFGEPVLTFMLPEEVFQFTGRLISLRAEYVSLLAPFIAQDCLAPLNCIRVEPAPGGGVLLVAVNNHGMGVFHDPDAYCEEAMNLRITKELVRNCKAKYGEYTPRRVVLDGENATIEGGSGKVFYIEPEPVLEDGNYPEWRRILEGAVNAATVASAAGAVPLYKPESLVQFNFPGVQNGQRTGLRIYPTGEESPIVVRHEAFPSFVGLAMPLFSGHKPFSPRPEWLTLAPDFEAVDRFDAIIEEAMVQ